MDRKVIFAGKIQPGISKSKNCLEIINEINTFKIKKEMKEILFQNFFQKVLFLLAIFLKKFRSL